MSGIEGLDYLDGDVKETREIQGATGEIVFEGSTLEVFHGNEGVAAIFADIVNRADVGMIQGRGGLRLAFESRQCLPIASQIIRKKLEGHESVEPCIFGFIDDTHPAAAELFQNAIVRNGLSEE